MQLSKKPVPHNLVDFFPLPNGMADVFLHRNEQQLEDEEGNIYYEAEEVYFQINGVSKKEIESNFDYMWADAERHKSMPTIEERVQALEMLEIERIMEGI